MNEGKRKLTSTFLKAGSIIGGLVLWHVLATVVVKDPTLLVSPVVVAVTAYQMLFVTKDLYPHVFASSWIFFYGFVLAILAGVPFGFLMALNTVGARLRQSVDGDALYDTADCFRAGAAALVRHRCRLQNRHRLSWLLFPILINSYYGMRVVNRDYVELARSFRLSRSALFLKILLPASVPFILAGIRLSVGRGLTGVAIAEWFGAREGLGYLIFFAGQTLNIPILFVGVAVFAALGIIGFEIIRIIEIYAIPWRKEPQES